MDHKTPLRRGGDHSKANVVPTCFLCNARKSDRTLEEFLAGERYWWQRRGPRPAGSVLGYGP
jgi:5-methylcytosine-specific restriction endonuclease McrA